jgi:hypothetical protein
MIRFVVLMLMLVTFLNLNAENIVDVYGADLEISDEIIKKYGAQIGNIEAQMIKSAASMSENDAGEYFLKYIFPKKNQLIRKIQHDYRLAYVDFDTILYPNDKNLYTTIEIVGRNDKERIKFIHNQPILKEALSKQDVINKMLKYQHTEFQLMLNNQLDTKNSICPIYHCLPGFSHPKLKHYFTLFSTEATQDKNLIINTLGSDPNSERRVAAIYLMGYFKDPKEIILLLTSYINDEDSGVRNAAMRVLGETMRKAKIYQINVLPFLSLLDSPYDTDRNKALLILWNAANLNSTKETIIRYGQKRLLMLLQLKQPNNHDLAYAILKKISGKDFGPRNYYAWEQWFSKMNHS